MPSASRSRRLSSSRIPAVLAALVVATSLAGCSSERAPSSDGRLQVEASFYPLQWMAQRVGGAHVDVGSLTKPGAEPHDLELTPKDVAAVADADLVVYLSGFQASVDAAVADAGSDGPAIFDARPAARLDLTYTPIEEGKEDAASAGATDPHFWQDPTRLAAVARSFERTLAERDPAHAGAYARNLRGLLADLRTLDQDFATDLRSCTNDDLVTSHNAFGYLARRYGLRQVGITGLTPEDEPSPRDLADITRFVERNHVRTIYFETLVSPAIARTVAKEAGAHTDVLDPIEGLNDRSQGRDYLAVMRSNLANLRRDQPCP